MKDIDPKALFRLSVLLLHLVRRCPAWPALVAWPGAPQDLPGLVDGRRLAAHRP
jgi:hypothetical protein